MRIPTDPRNRSVFRWSAFVIIAAVIAVAAIVSDRYVLHREGKLGCDPTFACSIIQCTPANPCIIGGKKYVGGNRCVPEGFVCDRGWLWDCRCTTVILAKTGNPDCDCR